MMVSISDVATEAGCQLHALMRVVQYLLPRLFPLISCYLFELSSFNVMLHVEGGGEAFSARVKDDCVPGYITIDSSYSWTLCKIAVYLL